MERIDKDSYALRQQHVQNTKSAKGIATMAGNQAMLSKLGYVADPVIQRAVSPKGDRKFNFYVQDKSGSIKPVDLKTYNASRQSKSEEPGYTEFISGTKAVNYSPDFLTEIYDEDNHQYTYRKKAGIALPVSCVEAATWAMRVMGDHRRRSYPGYCSFTDKFYELMDAIEARVEAEKLERTPAGTARVKEIIEEILSGTSYSREDYESNMLKFNRISTGANLWGDEGKGFSLDRCKITNDIINRLTEYTGTYDVGDGIFIAELINEKEEEGETGVEFHVAFVPALLLLTSLYPGLA